MRVTVLVITRACLLFVLAAHGGCGGQVGEDSPCECDDPSRPFCDEKGIYPASGGEAGTCIPTPKQTLCDYDGRQCTEGGAELCVLGEPPERTICQAGCEQGECVRLEPSNGMAHYLEVAREADGAVFSNHVLKIDTDAGTITDLYGAPVEGAVAHKLFLQANGVPLRIFTARSWDMRLVLVSGDAALSIVSGSNLTIRGQFDLGTAGHYQGSECAEVVDESDCYHFTASGGQGNGSAGGHGNTTNQQYAWVTEPGRAIGNDRIIPLQGGCSENSGGGLQLVAAQSIAIGGVIKASGLGGRQFNITHCAAGPQGNGGGAGGSVLLEAPEVKFIDGENGAIVANGGGGACWGAAIRKDGRSGGTTAEGSGRTWCDGTYGGAGGTSMMPAGEDGMRGGGGGVGRIRINTIIPFEDNAHLISPPATFGNLADVLRN